MKRLKDILYRVSIEAVHGATDVTISKIEFDSRKVESNTAFVAIKGTLSDGHDYIEKAIALGANVIVCEQFPETIVQGITYVQVNDTNEALAYLSANFYDNPSEKIKLVGVTGTNGKTTIASLLYQLFKTLSSPYFNCTSILWKEVQQFKAILSTLQTTQLAKSS